MKRITIIILFSLALFECHNADRDEIKRGQEQFFYFAALALYIPNFCEPAQLILEEGQTYNITLEPGKRFWFDFMVRSVNPNNTTKKIRLIVNKVTGTNFNLDSNNCSSPIDENGPFVIPKSSSSNQIIYELTIFRGRVLSSLILNSGDPNTTLSFEIF
ncbi:MAG: hypothetical protein MH321_16070 [Leptospiraceae bacterium]|nr:hypothetical protein [Leptospiraceae bacterium]